MISLMSSVKDARDVGPKYLSLRPLFGFVAKRPRGLAYNTSVTMPGDCEAGTSSIGLAWSAGGVVGAVRADIDDPSKRRFSEFRVSSTEDCQSSVRKLPATVLTKWQTYFQILKATAHFDYSVATANCELIFEVCRKLSQTAMQSDCISCLDQTSHIVG